MKSLVNQASILHNTNRVVANTSADWSMVEEGDFLKIDKDKSLYTIQKANKNFYLKDFELIGKQEIQIKDDIGIELITNDEIILSYKEYELYAIFDIISGGKGYNKDDVVYVDDGKASYDTINGKPDQTSFVVTETDEKGAIKKIAIKEKGKYTTPPQIKSSIVHSRGGGAFFELEYKEVDQRKSIERRIAKVTFDAPNTKILLDYPLPDTFETGKLSCHKWEALLNANYLGETKVDVSFRIIKDYSPNLKIPYMLPNSNSPELLYNYLINKVDGEIASLKNEIAALKEELKLKNKNKK